MSTPRRPLMLKTCIDRMYIPGLESASIFSLNNETLYHPPDEVCLLRIKTPNHKIRFVEIFYLTNKTWVSIHFELGTNTREFSDLIAGCKNVMYIELVNYRTWQRYWEGLFVERSVEFVSFETDSQCTQQIEFKIHIADDTYNSFCEAIF